MRGYALLDRRLDLPEDWCGDAYADRRAACGLPDDLSFTTKPLLGWAMIDAVVQSKILRCRWVTCDEAFGGTTELLDKLASLDRW